MKKMTRFLALFVALAMMLALFAGCASGSNENSGDPVVNEEEKNQNEITENTEGFFDAIFDLEYEKAAAFLDDGYGLYDLLKEKGGLFDNFQDEFLAELPAETDISGRLLAKFEDATIGLMEVAMDNSSYELGDIEIDGDKATIKVDLQMFGEDSIDESMLDSEELFEDFIYDSGVAVEDLATYSEDELGEIMIEYIVYLLEYMAELIEAGDVEYEEVSGNMELEFINDKWVIVGDDGLDLEEYFE